jgi:1,4-alpha-glucan branching enzyme
MRTAIWIKSDPYAFEAQMRPETASMIAICRKSSADRGA